MASFVRPNLMLRSRFHSPVWTASVYPRGPCLTAGQALLMCWLRGGAYWSIRLFFTHMYVKCWWACDVLACLPGVHSKFLPITPGSVTLDLVVMSGRGQLSWSLVTFMWNICLLLPPHPVALASCYCSLVCCGLYWINKWLTALFPHFVSLSTPWRLCPVRTFCPV